MLQCCIPFLPEGSQAINEHVAIFRNEGQITFFNASGAIFSYSEDDPYGLRLAQAVVLSNTTVRPSQLAKALQVDRATVYRNRERFDRGGPSALVIDKRSNRRGYKLSGETLQSAQRLLDEGWSLRKAATQIGVSEGCVRYALRQGSLVQRKAGKHTGAGKYTGPSERSTEDSQRAGGMAVKREAERALAATGKLEEAPASFSANESVRYAGILLALPVLLQLGLLDAARKTYGGLRNGFYGLQAIMLTLAFMALLRIKSPEQLKGKAPGELGIVLGLDRAPEVKTLRRRLREMSRYCKAPEFMATLSQRWSDGRQEALGFVYIDGHVRPYHGRKHKLPKSHVARRRLCMPATTDVWVNDTYSQPLFLVTAEANNSLLSMIDQEIIPSLRTLAGDRRVTLIFDREGWSPKCFARWFENGFDVITYRKGAYTPWPEECFVETRSQVRDRPRVYRLGERCVKIGKTFWMREIRRLCDDGHQTSVMTTRQDLDAEQIARRMFFRWTQENFFRYMRHEYNLDHLLSWDVEPADADRLVPSPERKEKSKQISLMKTQHEKLLKEYGQRAATNPESGRPTMRGFNIANAGYKRKVRLLEQQIKRAKAELAQIPKKVPLNTVVPKHEIVRLEKERKFLSDAVKMLCYRAESSLLNLVGPLFARHRDEGRAFLKSVFALPADILPDQNTKTLTVTFHSMANQRSNRALAELCQIMTAEGCRFPKTNLKMVFVSPSVASESVTCQEF